MHTSSAARDGAAWPLALVLGPLLGCATAAVCVALLHRLTLSRVARKPAATLAVLTRRQRAEKLLESMRRESATAAGAAGTDQAHMAGRTEDGEDSWESTSSGSEGSSGTHSSSEDVDSEYDRMEALRLKMVFVVRNTVQPKITAQEVAVLTASAGIELVELLQRSGPDLAEEQQRWRSWYLWWNRIGCAKITLRCPDADTMELIVATAREHGLPIAQLHRPPPSPETAVRAKGIALANAAQPREVVVLALGPAPSDVLEPITGSLKLFS
ncbi:Peptidyl-tRNA hydrolase PTH2 [Novymonas esmeraldas]|uniref:peptidyl-tRNA hydrolase n=1 Tax=Novymonas esmeraldas TaxID=1808958 RepID=A0AAW0F7T6_9TRYP